jgi:hypothetical protein
MPRKYTQHDLAIIWARSGNRCSAPGCEQRLVEAGTASDPDAVVGEIAHIVAASDTGPRSDATVAAEDRNRPENLILLCPTHHTLVDAQASSYTADDLWRWKQEHEVWVEVKLERAVTHITFVELEAVAGSVASAPLPEDQDLTLHPVREKMTRNELTERVDKDLTIGLLGAETVRLFLEQIAVVDANFPNRLRSGFVREYDRLRADGSRGDALFAELLAFAGGDSSDFLRQAASRAVLAYLFQVCDVFER